MQRKPSISILGSGVVGQATGLSFAVRGYEVLFYDVDLTPLNQLPDWAITTQSLAHAFAFGEVLILCLPTPEGRGGRCDLSIYEDVIHDIGELFQDNAVQRTIVQKSTCPPGTAQEMTSILIDDYACDHGDVFTYIVNPEFLNAGQPLTGAMAPAKVLCGGGNVTDLQAAKLLYGWAPDSLLALCTWEEAELAKYANNLFHALLISMWNELDLAAKGLEYCIGCPSLDMDKVARLTALEPGLESVYRVFGKAWGGACLPKDARAWRAFCDQFGIAAPIANALIVVNEMTRAKAGVRTEHWHELHGD